MMFIHLADAFIKHNLQVRQNAKQATGEEKPGLVEFKMEQCSLPHKTIARGLCVLYGTYLVLKVWGQSTWTRKKKTIRIC